MQKADSHSFLDSALLMRRFNKYRSELESGDGPGHLVPACVAAVQQSGGLSAEFPVCISEEDGTPSIRPVAEIIEEAARALVLTSDEAEYQAKVVTRLIREITLAAGQEKEKTLADLWGAAATTMIANPNLPESEREIIRQTLSQLRKQVTTDGRVIGFGPDTPARLLALVEEWWLAELKAGLVSEVAELAEVLKNEMDTCGADVKRSNRLTELVNGLNAWKHQVVLNGKPEEVPVERSLQTYIRDKVQERLSFYRTLYMARLEAVQAYREDEHDELFDTFTFDDLSAEDRASFPPVSVKVEADRLGEVSSDAILPLLENGVPIKMLVTVGSYDPACLSGWRTQLAERAMAIGRVFVMQTTASRAVSLIQGLQEGLRFAGSALFVVFTGQHVETHGIEPDLYAQLAADSRVYPSFVYDPSAGEDQASRFRLIDNKQPEQKWVSLHAPDTTGKGGGKDFVLTAAEFLVCDARLSREYVPVPAGFDRSLLVPLDHYLEESEAASASKAPFILMADSKGKEQQVIVSPAIVRAARTVRARWRCLQERGGIHNSHAERAVALTKERLLLEFEIEKEDIQRRHQEEIEQMKGAMAQQIVSNIAAGLLGLGTDGVNLSVDFKPAALVQTPAAPVAAPAARPSEPEPPAEPAPVAEEEESLSLDEAYIDTPDCTSCDECINRNDKIFAYNEDGKAYVKDPRGGPYRDLVEAAEKCPAGIIHPGKPLNPDEPDLAELMKRAEPYL